MDVVDGLLVKVVNALLADTVDEFLLPCNTL